MSPRLEATQRHLSFPPPVCCTSWARPSQKPVGGKPAGGHQRNEPLGAEQKRGEENHRSKWKTSITFSAWALY